MPHATVVPACTDVPLVSVVVPAKNERDNIPVLIAEIQEALDGVFAYELIYVDDGSSDGSFDALKTLKVSVPQLKALRHAKACGQSLAVLSGVRAASGQWLVVLDADGQNDPADIPAMLRNAIAAYEQDSLLVGLIGQRIQRKGAWKKRMASRIANGFRAWMLQDNTPDIGCGLKVLRRDWYLRLPAFNHMHHYIPVLVQTQGGTMRSHPVGYRERFAGQSNYGVWDRLWVGLGDVLGVWWLKRRSKSVAVVEQI